MGLRCWGLLGSGQTALEPEPGALLGSDGFANGRQDSFVGGRWTAVVNLSR